MIQRRTWKDVTLLPNGEGVMESTIIPIGQISFAGMIRQFTGPNPDDIAEQAARWIIQSTGQDEIEQIALRVVEKSDVADTSIMSNFILTKVGTAVVVSPSLIKPKVYR